MKKQQYKNLILIKKKRKKNTSPQIQKNAKNKNKPENALLVKLLNFAKI